MFLGQHGLTIPKTCQRILLCHGPLTRCAKLRVAHALGMSGRFPRHRLQRKLLVSDIGMHHSMCVTHVPWRMSESLNRNGGENVPDIPGARATRNFTYPTRGSWRSHNLVRLPELIRQGALRHLKSPDCRLLVPKFSHVNTKEIIKGLLHWHLAVGIHH